MFIRKCSCNLTCGGGAGRKQDGTDGKLNWGYHSEDLSQPDGSSVARMSLSWATRLGLYTPVLISPWIQAAPEADVTLGEALVLG